MTYTALYRRYRPATFADLVGQPHVARVLANAVRRGQINHAYLFCGPRGTGKTSTARIFARAVNCERPLDNGDPCGECAACRRALAGESMDVIEIDGASNRGIDEIRDLRERVKYAPAQERYKVYIIDEVHMLTNDAFNALLKTLEEPPAHVVFVFATTAPHKLPLTVLSRCQRFDFRRIGDTEIARHLLALADAERIPLTEDAANLIARKAEGGMRDAISLLDQCASACAGAAGGEELDAAQVRALLGAVDRGFILDLLRCLLERDTLGALALVGELEQSGRDLRQAVDDLLEATRDALLSLLAKDGGAATEHNFPAWISGFAPAAYLALLQALSDADSRMRYALSPRITLELTLIRCCGVPEQAAEAADEKRTKAESGANAGGGTSGARSRLTSDTAKEEPGPAPRAAGDRMPDDATGQRTPADAPHSNAAEQTEHTGRPELGQTKRTAAEIPPDALPITTVAPPERNPVAATGGRATAPLGQGRAGRGAEEEKTSPLPRRSRKTAPAGEAEARQTKPAGSVAPAAVPLDETEQIARVREKWPEILALIEQKNPGAYAVLRAAWPDRVEKNKLVLDLPPEVSMFLPSVLSAGQYRTLIENAVNRTLRASFSLGAFVGAARPEQEDDQPPPLPETADAPPEAEQSSLF